VWLNCVKLDLHYARLFSRCSSTKSIYMKFSRFICLSLFFSVGVFALEGRADACNSDQYCPEKGQRPNIDVFSLISGNDGQVDEPAGYVNEEIVVNNDGIFDVLQSEVVLGHKIQNLEALRTFYTARNFQPYWIGRDGPNDDAQALLEMLKESWTHGLNPYSYQIETTGQLFQQDDAASLSAFDVLMSDAYIEYGQDLTGIRVDPKNLKSDKRFWQQPLTGEYLLGLLGRYDIGAVVESIAPRGATYHRLRKELVRLVSEKPEAYEAVLPIDVNGAIRPYDEHKAVGDLRVRLGVGGNSDVYDDQLAARVIQFQKDNGLDADGIIGSATLSVLNKTRRQKIHQVIANLERLRWVPEAKPDKFVIVNVPSAMLWAVEDGKVAFDMPVIVGRKKRPTNIFITDITGIRINPTWTVPPTIKKEDILPKLVDDANYLESKGMELVYGRGEDALTLDPAAIDWTTVTEDELKTLRMVQIPGAHNPLGYYRVLMPNSYNIYLHDTNEPHYFNKAGRAVSSGCVRMKNPRKMADFILREKRGWTTEKTQEVLEKGTLKDLYVQNTIPVYIVYYTAWVDDRDGVVLSNDLYGYDDEIIKMLTNLDEIFIPVDNT